MFIRNIYQFVIKSTVLLFFMYFLNYLDIFIESATQFILASLDSAEQLIEERQVAKSVTYH